MMRRTLVIAAACAIVSIGCSKQKSRILCPSTPPPGIDAPVEPPRATTWNFDDDPPGRLPTGWRIGETKPAGTPATWAVVADAGAVSPPNVLAITETKNTGGTYNLAIARDTSFKDLDLTVKVRADTGKEDQGGGPLWRARDADHYYLCRLNPLEGNFRVYKVVGGKRQQLATADTDARAGEWHTIRVVMKAGRIECFLNDEQLLTADDNALTEAGMIGLWTKADAATAFDDLTAWAVD